MSDKSQELTSVTTDASNSKSAVSTDQESVSKVDASGAAESNVEPIAPEPVKEVPYFAMYRYATSTDWFMLMIGTIFAAANGVAMPGFSLVFGELLNALSVPGGLFFDKVTEFALNFVWIGLGSLTASWGSIYCFMAVGEYQAKRIREHYLRAIMRQEMAWFDQHKAGELSTRLASDTDLIQEGMSQKAQNYVQFMSTFVAGIALGFVRGWQLTLVILAVTPLLAIAGGIMTTMLQKVSQKGSDAYAKAGEVADEVLTSLKTVSAMNGEAKERKRYDAVIQEACESGISGNLMSSIAMGSINIVIFGAYGLALWYGSKLIVDQTINPATNKPYTGGDIVSVFFSVLMGSFAIGQAAPSFPAFANAKGAAYRIFEVIDRKPEIDSASTEGQKLSKLQGDIVFENVHFAYPSRPEAKVLNGLNLRIPAGKTVALVGHSGCGKSTLIGLLERWYNPDEGRILIDGELEIKQLNLKWWRQTLGLVQQEPILFGVSLKQNIALGLPSSTAVTDKQVEDAARAANAFDFIDALPEKFDTMIGESGVEQLSGGQKQRVAIARAIVKNPKILLLDESTSALDNESERIVQEALDRLMPGRTTIVIAHRLTTIRNADIIAVIDHGQVVEQGSHEELLQLNGMYASLLRAQQAYGDSKSPASSSSSAPSTPVAAASASSSTDIKVTIPSASVDRDVVLAGSEEHKDAEVKAKSASPTASASATAAEEKPAEAQEVPLEAMPEVPLGRVLNMQMDDWPWFVIGMFGALCNGSIFPLFSQIFSEMLSAFFITDLNEMKARTANMAYAFVGLGFAMFIVVVCQRYAFGVLGERLTLKLRRVSFATLLRQNIGFFDDEMHQPRLMGAKLATEANLVRGTAGENLGMTLQTITMLIAGVVLAFIYGWKMAFVVLGVGPLIGIAGALQMKFIGGFTAETKKALEKSGQIATESLAGMKTVSAFAAEEAVIARYEKQLQGPLMLGERRAHVAGAGFGSSQFILFGAYALCFWFGGWLTKRGDMTFDQVLKTFFAIVMSAMGVGQATGFAPDAQKAQYATRSIFQLIDRQPEIDSESDQGSPAELQSADVRFENVEFVYPTRPDVPIFRGVNFEVKSGQKVALVGPSGSGKSTCISMLLRFYNPSSGTIFIGNRDIKQLNIKSLRSQLGIVSQEPVLFATSILENIRYGNPNASDEQCFDAARRANAESFIKEFPDGFQTQVGPKGSQLSGGQKQRIAIARALLRDPKLLLLDEATSALDNESERVVQKALDELMVGRTTIIVAHRLSTIRTADKIVVIDRGVVVEQGTYDQLIKAGGMFAALASVHAQRAQHDHDVLASSSAPEVVATAAGDELQLTQNKLFAQ